MGKYKTRNEYIEQCERAKVLIRTCQELLRDSEVIPETMVGQDTPRARVILRHGVETEDVKIFLRHLQEFLDE